MPNPMETNLLVDATGAPLGTEINPLRVTGAAPFVDGASAAGSPFTIAGTGPTASFMAVGYPTIAVELMAGSVSLQLEASNDDPGVPDASAIWRAVAGTDPNQPSAQATTTAIGTGAPRRNFAKLARRYRLNCTTFVLGPATVAVILSTTPPTERGAYVYGGSLALTAGSAVIGSTALRSAGTNRSATVGTTAVTLMPANPNRQGWKVKNDSTGDIWISFDAAATAAAGGGNIRIPSGGYLASEPGFVETGAMSAIGSAAGLTVTAREH